MARVVNPIYDTVFKYIMQDPRVAKVLIGNILNTKIEDISMNNNEYSAILPDGKHVFKLDFTATILDNNNKKQLIHIEVQKALESGEIMRFREYLGALYMDKTKCDKEIVQTYKGRTKEIEHPYPIHSIYILGHELGDGLKYSVMKGENIFFDQQGNVINVPENNDYIKGLTHKITFVIAPLTKNNVKTHLDRLLTIFCECNPNNPQHEIEIDEYFDDSEDYKILIQALQKASGDKQLQGNLNLEQHAWKNFINLENENKDLKEIVNEQHSKLVEQENKLIEKENQIRKTVKKLNQLGESIEDIAKFLSIDIQKVEEYLK
ncbi:MAG: hypothetical protein MJ211_04595 [Bacteroidales bacterium]|nr:hypothetical protein [Bacteroidales bacterium]